MARRWRMSTARPHGKRLPVGVYRIGSAPLTHGLLDLASDAQAAVALTALPVFACGVALVSSAATGGCVELMRGRRGRNG